MCFVVSPLADYHFPMPCAPQVHLVLFLPKNVQNVHGFLTFQHTFFSKSAFPLKFKILSSFCIS